MTPLNELVRISFMEGPGNEKDYIVDHVAVAAEGSAEIYDTTRHAYARYIVQKLAQRFYGIVSKVLELVNENLGSLF